MPQPEMQNKKIKEDIKDALNKEDFIGLLKAGFESFLNMISGSSPIPFQRFLKYTGMSFDEYILDTSKQESLKYVGGKMILEIVPSKDHTDSKDNEDSTAIPIRLSADFYFQTPDKKWVVQKKSGQISSERFSDWSSDEKAMQLQAKGKLELSIEPPTPEGK